MTIRFSPDSGHDLDAADERWQQRVDAERDEYELRQRPAPAPREHRVRCAHCKGSHSSAAEVHECAAEQAEAEANARAEIEMERRAERWWEERGAQPEDPRELGWP